MSSRPACSCRSHPSDREFPVQVLIVSPRCIRVNKISQLKLFKLSGQMKLKEFANVIVFYSFVSFLPEKGEWLLKFERGVASKVRSCIQNASCVCFLRGKFDRLKFDFF